MVPAPDSEVKGGEPVEKDILQFSDSSSSSQEHQLDEKDISYISAPACTEPDVGGDEAVERDDARSVAHSLANQMNILSSKQLLIAFPALSVALFVSFIDQTSIATSIPAVAADLNAGASISWVGASFLIASTAFQLINGRLSDIFGRKICLLVCLGLLALGDLLCGFATSASMLFGFRAIAGIGAGGVNSVAMIIVSDIVTLEKRGKFQGIIGAVIALANGIGPFVGGALVEKASWRWVFWIVPMIAVPAMVTIWFYLPIKQLSGGYAAKFKKIDFVGVVLNIAAVLLILIPVSGGGGTYAWSSPLVIAMLTVGGVLAILFVLYEWKLAPIPIMPLHITRYPSCSLLYIQNFFTGLVFFSNFFYLPIYFQSVRGYSPLAAGALLLPLIIATATGSISSGQFMSRVGKYKPLVVAGFGLWTVGTGLKLIFQEDSQLWLIIVSGIIEGVGIGWTLQPTLVAILANSANEDRAVATGLRNFLRTVGGAFGLTISGAILNNVLRAKLEGLPYISENLLQNLASSTYNLASEGLSSQQGATVVAAFMAGLHDIFILYVISAGLNFLMSIFIRNTSLRAKKTSDIEADPAPIVSGDNESGIRQST